MTRRYPPLIGGAERVLSYLGPALAAEGLDVTVLTSRLDDSPALEVGPGSFRVERLATSPLRFVGTMVYLRQLSRWFARNRVDLAYVSMLKHDAYATLGASKRQGFPVVLRPEGAGLNRRYRLAVARPVRSVHRPPLPPGRRPRRHLPRRSPRTRSRRLFIEPDPRPPQRRPDPDDPLDSLG